MECVVTLATDASSSWAASGRARSCLNSALRRSTIPIATADPNENDRIYRELMGIFRVEQPITYLLPAISTSVVHRRIQGLSTPFRADPLRFLEDLWLEDEN